MNTRPRRWSPRRAIGNTTPYLCWALDIIPAYQRDQLEDGTPIPGTGHWHRHGQWGCRIGISKLWGKWDD
jgi:hypothetical protein